MNTLSVSIKVQLGNFHLDACFQSENNILVLFGPSGSGKSTILSCIAGLRKPNSGTIKYNEEFFFSSAERIHIKPQDRGCAYVLQDSALFPHLTVAENICFAINKESRLTQEKRLTELMEIFRLDGMRDFRISQLSGGQAKRVAIARAIARTPDILLMDEPFNGLDAELRADLAKEIKVLQNSLNIPTVLVTHSRAEALYMADSVVLLENGKSRAQGSAVDLLAEDRKRQQSSDDVQFSW